MKLLLVISSFPPSPRNPEEHPYCLAPAGARALTSSGFIPKAGFLPARADSSAEPAQGLTVPSSRALPPTSLKNKSSSSRHCLPETRPSWPPSEADSPTPGRDTQQLPAGGAPAPGPEARPLPAAALSRQTMGPSGCSASLARPADLPTAGLRASRRPSPRGRTPSPPASPGSPALTIRDSCWTCHCSCRRRHRPC